MDCRKWGALIACMVSVADAPWGLAEPSKPQEFYERDYAIAPNVGGQGGGAQARPRSKRSVANEGLKDGNTPAERAPTRGKKRRMLVNVTVNSLDTKHFAAVMEVVKRLHDSRLAFVGVVSHVGDYRSLTPELESELARRGIEVVEGMPPDGAKRSTVSPRWEILARDGFHVAEGFISIEPLINEWGDYDPELARKGETKPEAKIEGF